MTVNDRAKALIQLSKTDYLSTFSMPDLFHFMQDLGHSVGGQLGLQVSQATKKLRGKDCESADYDLLRKDLVEKQGVLKKYKLLREGINQRVHPFNEKDELITSEAIQIQVNVAFTKIRGLAKQAGITISLEKGQKILSQIPDIADGVAYWVKWLQSQIRELNLTLLEEKWLEESLLPYAYWQVHQTKKTRKKKDSRLNEYCQSRVQQAKSKFEQDPLTTKIEEAKKEELVNWAFKQVASFHRASSSVEGRNGYLAFIHHANKGIPEKRKKVLTVIHNFDIRRADGKTPAQRLFNKDFPSLFEFILDNIGELPRPRERKMKRNIKS